MKRLHALLAWLLLASTSWAANVYCYTGATGLTTLYLRVDEAGTLDAVALTEGAGGYAGRYYVTEANLVSALVNTPSTGNGFYCTVHSGSSPSTTAADPILGYLYLPWSGSAELPASANTIQWAGANTATDDIALLAQLAAANFVSNWFTAAGVATDAANEIGAASSGGGGGSAAQVINTKVVPPRVIDLSDRDDGTTVGTKLIRTRVGEPLAWWINTAPIAGGEWLASVSAATSSVPGELSVTDYGVNRELAVIVLDTTNAVVGTTYTVTVDIVPAAGQVIKAKVSVKIIGD